MVVRTVRPCALRVTISIRTAPPLWLNWRRQPADS
jgi:hypothetical protein